MQLLFSSFMAKNEPFCASFDPPERVAYFFNIPTVFRAAKRRWNVHRVPTDTGGVRGAAAAAAALL